MSPAITIYKPLAGAVLNLAGSTLSLWLLLRVDIINDCLKNVSASSAKSLKRMSIMCLSVPFIEILLINFNSHEPSGKSLALLTNGYTFFYPITHHILPFALAQFNVQLQ